MTQDPPERPDNPGDDPEDDPGDDPEERPTDPLSAMFGQLFGQQPGQQVGQGGIAGLDPGLAAAAGIPSDPHALSQILGQVQRLLSTTGEGPVNWDLARDVARQAAVAAGDPSVAEPQRRDVVEALHVADLWLDGVTDLPAAGATARAWSRSEWVEATLPVWRRLSEPVATSVADAMATAMAQQAPEELRPMVAAAGKMVRQVGGAVFGMQVGQAVGGLAAEVVAATDVGLPLVPDGTTALLPGNVAAFGEGLGVPAEEVRLYLALREAAHARLFAHVGWLRAHLLGAVEAYARGITIDTDRIEQAVAQVDPTDPQALQEALSNGLFEPLRTPEQQAALDRLETALALVEGWVDEVTNAAASDRLGSATALREAVRRRRAAGGPAEHTLASLVGLELRPRRLRDAATLWHALGQARGQGGRDAVWQHPDLLPTADDLDDPAGFAQRRGDAEAAGADVDAALERLLRGETDEPPQ
jgi:putative hydrolase